MREYFQPTLLGFSEMLESIGACSYDPSRRIPLPDGWSVGVVKAQIILSLYPPAALKFRLSYGYISSIRTTDSYDTGSPFFAQSIPRLPFRLGSSPAENENRRAYCRVDAFASCACLPSPAQAVRIGMPVCGLGSMSPRDHKTAQLAGRPTTTAAGWKLLSPEPSPPGELSFRYATFIACISSINETSPRQLKVLRFTAP